MRFMLRGRRSIWSGWRVIYELKFFDSGRMLQGLV